jgi:hypothetical protein
MGTVQRELLAGIYSRDSSSLKDPNLFGTTFLAS